SQTKYPDVVTLPEGLQGDHITLRNPTFELVVVWKIRIDEEGRTTPVLDLLTKVPEQGNAILEQNMATIENAPTHFRSLLLLLGIEAAIENLIRNCRANAENNIF
uniref:Centromere protein P n=1 Tax=Calidris pygmaea TaxID=425635 RepID=A0A8C3KQL1_9CHAR